MRSTPCRRPQCWHSGGTGCAPVGDGGAIPTTRIAGSDRPLDEGGLRGIAGGSRRNEAKTWSQPLPIVLFDSAAASAIGWWTGVQGVEALASSALDQWAWKTEGVTSLAEQYAWFVGYSGSDSYCLTLVKDRSEMEVLSLLGGDDVRRVPNMDAVWHETQELEETAGVVAALAVEGWVLVFEPYGYRGVNRAVAERLSSGTRCVSHFRNIELDTAFMWAEDGAVQAKFELQSPWDIAGAKALEMKDVLMRAGFAAFESGDNRLPRIYLPAAMALTDMLTGLRITRDLLDDSPYTCVTVRG